jgi:hypothetical protein
MHRGVRIPEEVEATIKAELAKIPHASLVARESRGAWSYATVWRVAARAGIELTAGRRTMGRPLPPERRAKVEQAVAAHPDATRLELARQTGVRRPRGAGAARRAAAGGVTRNFGSGRPKRHGMAYFIRRRGDDCAVNYGCEATGVGPTARVSFDV